MKDGHEGHDGTDQSVLLILYGLHRSCVRLEELPGAQYIL